MSVKNRNSMKFFSKIEMLSVVVIFLILVGISWPNFTVSLRRARDQIRRDDMGLVQTAITNYYTDHGYYPPSSPDGKFIVCKDGSGNPIACEWGQEWVSPVFTDKKVYVDKVYMKNLPQDPNFASGTSFAYFSDAGRYQLFGALEGTDEPEYDSKLVARGIACGNKVCNIGRAYNVPLYMTIEEYNLMVYCSQKPKDPKCVNVPK